MNFKIYCDESCPEVMGDKSSHRYLGIGGIWIPAEKRIEFKDDISNIR